MRRTSDPRRIEAFLLSQDGVLDASVWFQKDELRAHITPVSHTAVCVVQLQKACEESLGKAATPESILVVPR